MRLGVRVPARGVTADPGSHVDLLGILSDDDDSLLDRYGRWYIADRDPRWLRRNALVILGNVATVPADDSVRRVLSRYLSHHDSMLRAHAVWASRRLRADDLLGSVAADDDPAVRDELTADVPAR